MSFVFIEWKLYNVSREICDFIRHGKLRTSQSSLLLDFDAHYVKEVAEKLLALLVQQIMRKSSAQNVKF